MGNKKSHMSYEERFCIEKMLAARYTVTDISKVLNRGKSTISNEVNRSGLEEYKAAAAHNKSLVKQYEKKQSISKVLNDKKLQKCVLNLISQKYSPEQISLLTKKSKKIQYASPKSIRNFLRKTI